MKLINKNACLAARKHQGSKEKTAERQQAQHVNGGVANTMINKTQSKHGDVVVAESSCLNPSWYLHSAHTSSGADVLSAKDNGAKQERNLTQVCRNPLICAGLGIGIRLGRSPKLSSYSQALVCE